jgi:hypothetical protein
MSKQTQAFKRAQANLAAEPRSIVYAMQVRMLANRLITAYC